MSQIKVYGTKWGSDCQEAKTFLDTNGVDYQWTNLEEEPEYVDYVKGLNNGQEIVPTIIFPDGSFLSEPSNEELKQKLDL